MNGNGYAQMFQPSHYSSRSQDLEPAFHDAGQFVVEVRSVEETKEHLILMFDFSCWKESEL